MNLGRPSAIVRFLILSFIISASISNQLFADAAVFKENIARYRYQNSQPFSGSLDFSGTPQFGKPTHITIVLTAQMDLDTTQTLMLVTLGLRNAEFSPAELIWEPPIDSGATRSFDVVFTPEWVGGYEILLSRYIDRTWQNMGRLILSLDEDGKVNCFGSLADCGSPAVPLHPYRKASNLSLAFPQIPERKSQPGNRDFAASFRFLTPPKKGDTTLVEVNLEIFRGLYSEVQFVAEHSTSIKITEMPQSWGNSVGLNPRYRHFTDTLSFVLLKDGLAYLNFQVVGKHPYAQHGDRITTSFPLYFVTTAEDGLIFLGDFNPIERFATMDKSVLGSLTQLLTAGSSDYRIKYTLSEPDFRSAEDSSAVDSTENSTKR